MKKILLLASLSILLNKGVYSQKCPEGWKNWSYGSAVPSIDFFACIEPKPGLMGQQIFWAVRCRFQDYDEVSFDKVIVLTCGQRIIKHVSLYSCKRDVLISGGSFSGDPELSDNIFKESCDNNENRISGVTIQNIRGKVNPKEAKSPRLSKVEKDTLDIKFNTDVKKLIEEKKDAPKVKSNTAVIGDRAENETPKPETLALTNGSQQEKEREKLRLEGIRKATEVQTQEYIEKAKSSSTDVEKEMNLNLAKINTLKQAGGDNIEQQNQIKEIQHEQLKSYERSIESSVQNISSGVLALIGSGYEGRKEAMQLRKEEQDYYATKEKDLRKSLEDEKEENIKKLEPRIAEDFEFLIKSKSDYSSILKSIYSINKRLNEILAIKKANVFVNRNGKNAGDVQYNGSAKVSNNVMDGNLVYDSSETIFNKINYSLTKRPFLKISNDYNISQIDLMFLGRKNTETEPFYRDFNTAYKSLRENEKAAAYSYFSKVIDYNVRADGNSKEQIFEFLTTKGFIKAASYFSTADIIADSAIENKKITQLERACEMYKKAWLFLRENHFSAANLDFVNDNMDKYRKMELEKLINSLFREYIRSVITISNYVDDKSVKENLVSEVLENFLDYYAVFIQEFSINHLASSGTTSFTLPEKIHSAEGKTANKEEKSTTKAASSFKLEGTYKLFDGDCEFIVTIKHDGNTIIAYRTPIKSLSIYTLEQKTFYRDEKNPNVYRCDDNLFIEVKNDGEFCWNSYGHICCFKK